MSRRHIYIYNITYAPAAEPLRSPPGGGLPPACGGGAGGGVMNARFERGHCILNALLDTRNDMLENSPHKYIVLADIDYIYPIASRGQL